MCDIKTNIEQGNKEAAWLGMLSLMKDIHKKTEDILVIKNDMKYIKSDLNGIKNGTIILSSYVKQKDKCNQKFIDINEKINSRTSIGTKTVLWFLLTGTLGGGGIATMVINVLS